MFDYLIKNGIVIDGSGASIKKVDVAILKDKIAAIGNLQTKKAKVVIDGEGLIIVPGFIDVLSHSDSYWTLFLLPEQESLVRQGITTIIGGNCGTSVFPIVNVQAIKSVQKWADIEEVNVNWNDFNSLRLYLKVQKVGVNFGSLVGYSTLRRNIIGDEYRNLTQEELEKMKFLFEEEMNNGALGLSLGLAYSHEKFVPFHEFRELIKILATYKGILAIHLKNEGEYLLESIQELKKLVAGFEKNIKLEISHFKSNNPNFYQNFALAIELLEEMKKAGIDINFDVYPYTTIASSAHILLPAWVLNGGRQEMIRRLKDKETRKEVIEELKNKKYNFKNFTIAMANLDSSFIGKRLEEVAENQSVELEEALINLILAAGGRLIYFNDIIQESNLELALSNPLSFVSSDGFGYSADYARKKPDLIHPRCFGAFPRFIKNYVLKKKLMPLEEAIYKLTFGPARKYGIKNRGLIKEKYFADLVIFDEHEIESKADFKNPFQYPLGIKYVFVNGEPVVNNSIYEPKMNGQVISRA